MLYSIIWRSQYWGSVRWNRASQSGWKPRMGKLPCVIWLQAVLSLRGLSRRSSLFCLLSRDHHAWLFKCSRSVRDPSRLRQCVIRKELNTRCKNISKGSSQLPLEIFFIGPFKYLNGRFLSPFYMPQLVKSLPFNIPKAWKRYPLRTEPPRIGHYREYPRRHILKPIKPISLYQIIRFIRRFVQS